MSATLTTPDRLTPRTRRLYAVRWVRADGRDVRHRYYTRRADAQRFHDQLQAGGWAADLFVTRCDWTATRPDQTPGEAHD